MQCLDYSRLAWTHRCRTPWLVSQTSLPRPFWMTWNKEPRLMGRTLLWLASCFLEQNVLLNLWVYLSFVWLFKPNRLIPFLNTRNIFCQHTRSGRKVLVCFCRCLCNFLAQKSRWTNLLITWPSPKARQSRWWFVGSVHVTFLRHLGKAYIKFGPLSSPERAECLRVCFHCLIGIVIVTLKRSYGIQTYIPDAGDFGELFWSGFGWDDSHRYAHTETKYCVLV